MIGKKDNSFLFVTRSVNGIGVFYYHPEYMKVYSRIKLQEYCADISSDRIQNNQDRQIDDYGEQGIDREYCELQDVHFITDLFGLGCQMNLRAPNNIILIFD